MSKLERFKKARKQLIENKEVVDVLLDEDFIPPNKSAAFTPYDAVICLNHSSKENSYSSDSEPSLSRVIRRNSSDGNDVMSYIEERMDGLEYDRIIGHEKNQTSEPGEYLVYISLESFKEYKQRW